MLLGFFVYGAIVMRLLFIKTIIFYSLFCLNTSAKAADIGFRAYTSFNTWHTWNTPLRSRLFREYYNDSIVAGVNTKMYRIFDIGLGIDYIKHYNKYNINYFANYDAQSMAINAEGFYETGKMQRRLILNYISAGAEWQKTIHIAQKEFDIGIGLSLNKRILIERTTNKSVLNFIPGKNQVQDDQRNEVFIPEISSRKNKNPIVIGNQFSGYHTFAKIGKNDLRYFVKLSNTYGNLFGYQWYFNTTKQTEMITWRQYNRFSIQTGLNFVIKQ